MKTGTVVLIVIALFVLCFGGCACNGYNGMVAQREEVKNAIGKMQSAYQRRMDLFNSLVSTLEASANFEKSALTDIIAARASATSIKLDASTLTPETLKAFQAQQGQIGAAMGRLMVVNEQYPDLKTPEQFKNLQATIEGTENRINVARNDYNTIVQSYNTSIHSFPNNILANNFGFKEYPSFEADTAAQHAPALKFNIK